MNNRWTSIFLVGALLLLLNLFSSDYFVRLDLTENKQYTLSKATVDLLKNLEESVTLTAYFTQDLPEQYQKGRRDLEEMLVEYATLSKGKFDFTFISPNEDSEKEQEAIQQGVQPLLINLREKDQVKQQKAFMGAILEMSDRKEVIPFLEPGMALEYSLSTSIKKLAVVDKPVIGLIQGHGEPNLQSLQRMLATLGILYNVQPVTLDEAISAAAYKTLMLINPIDSFSPGQLSVLDNYLGEGGKLVAAVNTVSGDFSTAMGSALSTGIPEWLAKKGVMLSPSFIVDAQCGAITVQQKQGFFTFNSQAKFPFLPLVSDFPEHPVTKGIEQVIFPFVSALNFEGEGSGLRFTPLVKSSEKTGTIFPPTFFDVNKQWTANDFPTGKQTLGGLIEGDLGGNGVHSAMIIFGDGDFALNAQSPDNANLFINSVDFLSDDTGLIELRTKEVTSRPLDSAIMAEDASGKRQRIKLMNFSLPIFLVFILGFFRNQRNKNIRIKRMQENYN